MLKQNFNDVSLETYSHADIVNIGTFKGLDPAYDAASTLTSLNNNADTLHVNTNLRDTFSPSLDVFFL